MRILNVGDTVIGKSIWGTNLYKIDRVTEKRAYSGNRCFVREFRDGGSVDEYPRQTGYGSPNYSFATQEVIDNYNSQVKKRDLINNIKDIKLDQFTIGKLEKIFNLMIESEGV